MGAAAGLLFDEGWTLGRLFPPELRHRILGLDFGFWTLFGSKREIHLSRAVVARMGGRSGSKGQPHPGEVESKLSSRGPATPGALCLAFTTLWRPPGNSSCRPASNCRLDPLTWGTTNRRERRPPGPRLDRHRKTTPASKARPRQQPSRQRRLLLKKK